MGAKVISTNRIAKGGAMKTFKEVKASISSEGQSLIWREI